jgi:hypothetical protein
MSHSRRHAAAEGQRRDETPQHPVGRNLAACNSAVYWAQVVRDTLIVALR